MWDANLIRNPAELPRTLPETPSQTLFKTLARTVLNPQNCQRPYPKPYMKLWKPSQTLQKPKILSKNPTDTSSLPIYQVVCKPGSIKPHKRFEGEIYALTKEEGGRHTPFFSNYKPQFFFRTADITGTLPETLPETLFKPPLKPCVYLNLPKKLQLQTPFFKGQHPPDIRYFAVKNPTQNPSREPYLF